MRHPLIHWRVIALNSHSATFRQLPSLGAQRNSIRRISARARSGSNAPQNAPFVCMFRLSGTSVTLPQPAQLPSSKPATSWARSVFVCRYLTCWK